MDTLRNFTTLSHKDLLQLVARQEAVIAELRAVIAQQQTVIQGLQQRVSGLEVQLRRKNGGTGMPGNKPAQPRPQEPTAGRKVRSQGFGRPRMVPTDRVEHAVDVCPDCGTTLQGGWVQWTREVLELPLAPLQVVEHRFIARDCPGCGKRQAEGPGGPGPGGSGKAAAGRGP